MISEWVKLTGALTFEERQLVDYICETGLKGTRKLLKTRKHDTGRAQTEGAILAFEIIEDAQFTTCQEYLDQWKKLEEQCRKLRDNKQLLDYWKTRGQQLQLEFILDRLLAFRVMTHQVQASISARAGLYVGEWQKARKNDE